MIPADPVEILPKLEKAFNFAQRQVRRLVDKNPDYFPMYTVKGKWRHDGEKWTSWCEGFLPGMMWIFADETADPFWRERAEHYSRLIESRKDDRAVHDLGFLFYHGAHRRWYDATVREGEPDPSIREVVLRAGQTLAGRFEEKGGYLRSFLGRESTLIDLMMNVPLVLYTAIETGDDKLMDLASRHCATSRRYLVRGDGSTAHEAIFDTQSGECLRQSTQQGYRADSCWSRGLAWALYGFASCGRLLSFRPWLDTAQQCAQYLMERVAGDPVPCWDFDAPEESRAQKDSSAGAIAAAGLFELAEGEVTVGAGEARQRQYLRDFGLRILAGLCEPEYLAVQDPNWEGILRHGVYHMPKGLGVDESVMWGDFFFLDALQRGMRYLRSCR